MSSVQSVLEKSNLDVSDSNYLHYRDQNVKITILGGIHLYPVDRLKVTLKLEKVNSHNPLHKLRHSLDLYNDDQTEKANQEDERKTRYKHERPPNKYYKSNRGTRRL